MAQANDSITVTPGTGATVATHLANSKEYQAVMTADARGHIEGTLPTYSLLVPPTQVSTLSTNGHFDLWNGSASNVIRITGIWIVPNTNVNAGLNKGLRFDFYRTSAAGTGGTAFTYGGTSNTAATIVPKDTDNAALPSGVSARLAPSGGATTAHWLDFAYMAADDATASQVTAYMNSFAMSNLIKQPMRGEQEITVRPSQGFKIVQDNDANSPQWGFFIDFTIE